MGAIDVAIHVCESGAESPRFAVVERAVYAQAAGSLRLVKALEDERRERRTRESRVAVNTNHAA